MKIEKSWFTKAAQELFLCDEKNKAEGVDVSRMLFSCNILIKEVEKDEPFDYVFSHAVVRKYLSSICESEINLWREMTGDKISASYCCAEERVLLLLLAGEILGGKVIYV